MAGMDLRQKVYPSLLDRLIDEYPGFKDGCLEEGAVFIVPAESPIRTLADLQGRTIAISDAEFGAWINRYLRLEAALAVDRQYTVRILGAHDLAALAVANHQVDAGVLPIPIYHRYLNEGKLERRGVKPLAEIPAIPDPGAMTLTQYRTAVRRDIEWLLNAVNLATCQSFERAPEAADSVINYGIPGFGGRVASSVKPQEVESTVRRAILNFEPRIMRDSLRVTAALRSERMDSQTLVFQIEGDLWADPTPVHMFIKTAVDLETGEARIFDN